MTRYYGCLLTKYNDFLWVGSFLACNPTLKRILCWIYLFQAPSTAISWSVYEFFKWWLVSDKAGDSGSEKARFDYDTLTVMKSGASSGQIGSREGHLSPGHAKALGVDADHLVSKESIQAAVTMPSSSRLCWLSLPTYYKAFVTGY